MAKRLVAMVPLLGLFLAASCGLAQPTERDLSGCSSPTRTPVHPLFEPMFNLFGSSEPRHMAPPTRRLIQVASLAVVPRSGRWRFEPAAGHADVRPFTVALDVQEDGMITVVGASDAGRRPDGPLASSYLKPVADQSGTELIAYLMLDRLYRMTVTSATSMDGEAWFGIRPPQVAAVEATWLAP